MSNSIKYVPIGANIVVKFKKETETGLIIPDSAKTKMDQESYVVVAVGPKCEQIKVGDIVIPGLATSASTMLITVDGVDYLQAPEYCMGGILL